MWTFFNLQLAIQSPPEDPLRQAISDAIARTRARQTHAEKAEFYRQLAAILTPAMGRVERVAWDLVRTTEARSAFFEWVKDLEDTSDVPDLLANDRVPTQQHIIITFVMLLPRDSVADADLGALCDIEAPAWLTRATCQRLVAGLAGLTFAWVRTDGVYMQPGVRAPGPIARDLDDGWDNLALIQG